MNGRVLLLQNDTSNGIDPGRMLRGQGYAVAQTDDREKARELLLRGPDLVLADVDLLDEPGWETCLAECRRRAVPSLLFSGSRRLENLVNRGSKGDGVLLQADSLAEFSARVSSLTTLRRLRQQLAQLRHRVREREREQAEELRSAAQIQHSLIPTHLSDLGSYRFAWCFQPFERVGGDLFNVLQLDEDTVMAYLFDVSGHGVSSAMVSVSVYQSLSLQTGRFIKRVYVAPPYYKILSPAEVLGELELEYPFERFEKFFTITYLLLSISTGRVRYCSAGHPPPVLVRRDGRVELLRAGGGLIGLGVGKPFVEGEAVLEEGDRLYLYSDGVYERANRQGELFGEKRFFGLLDSLRDQSLQGGCNQVVERVRGFAEGRPQQDDLTLLGIEFLGG